MAISLASLCMTSALTPPRILIHGVAGVGKSTFAAEARLLNSTEWCSWI